MAESFTTGLPGLDRVLKGVMPGDNIVWQVDSVSDYRALVTPYVEAARSAGRRLVYFRFASHEPLLLEDSGVETYRPDPGLGFESFVAQVHKVIEDAGKHTVYVFDCLSELASVWAADQMLGNFFLLTLPSAVRTGDGHLLRLVPQPPRLLCPESPITETHPVSARRVPLRGRHLRPSHQGPAPFDGLDEHDPPLGRGRVPADHEQRRDFRGALASSRWPRAARRLAAGLLAQALPRGPADARRRARRPIARRKRNKRYSIA